MPMLKIAGHCKRCKKTIVVYADSEGYARWKETGIAIQKALPLNTAGEREFLMSGICEHCFDIMYGDDE